MSFVFNEALTSIVKGEIDYLNDTIKVALFTDAPDIDNDQYFSDLSGEASGAGYTAGGETLTSKTVTTDDTNDRTVADADDVEWTGLSATFRYIVIYQYTGVASTSRLISAIDVGSETTIDNGTYDIPWTTSGVFYIQNPS